VTATIVSSPRRATGAGSRRAREARVEARGLELLPQDRDEDQVGEGHERGDHRPLGDLQAREDPGAEWDEGDLAVDRRVEVEVQAVGVALDPEHAEREERGKDEPDRGVRRHEAGGPQRLDPEDADEREHPRAEDDRQGRRGARDEEDGDDAGQDGVGDGVPEQRDAAQHEERAEQPARRGHEPGREDDEQVVGGHAALPAAGAPGRAGARAPCPPAPAAGRRPRRRATRAGPRVGLARVGQVQAPAVLEPRRPQVAPAEQGVGGLRSGRGEDEPLVGVAPHVAPAHEGAQADPQLPARAPAEQRELGFRGRRPRVGRGLQVDEHAVGQRPAALGAQAPGVPQDAAARREQDAGQDDEEADEDDHGARRQLRPRGHERPGDADRRRRSGPRAAAARPGGR
jgi:hypothetical protein